MNMSEQGALLKYKNELINDSITNAQLDGTQDIVEFINIVTGILMEAEEIEDFNYVPFEGVGKQSKKLQVDGYSYNELDNVLNLFIASPLTYDNLDVLTISEMNRYIGRVTAFVENASFVKKHAEESAPGYGLACDLLEKYKNVQKYVIYILSDKLKSSNIKEIETQKVNNKPVEYNLWDISRLYELEQSKSGHEDIVINLNEFGVKGIPCLPASDTADYKAYLCNIPGRVLADLYNKYGGRLLEGNVRSFLQVRGNINKGIRNTILKEPEMFFAYNNGIAATADEIKTEVINGSLMITQINSLQIVNGGQTTVSLAVALLNDKKDGSEEKIQKIFVPMKLSIIVPEKADQLIANISRYANSQNPVREADLWSNHPYHIRLESFSRRILAPAVNGRQYGTYWYYERARGQYKQETYKATQKQKDAFELRNPKKQMFNKTDLAKFMLVVQQRPDIASAGGQKAFASFAESTSKKWEKDDASFNEEYYKYVIGAAILFRKTDDLVKKSGYNSYKANIVEYSISKILYTVSQQCQGKSVNYKLLWQKQDLTEPWRVQLAEVIKIVYEHLTAEKRPVENVTEWAKREACWEQAKQIPYQLHSDFISDLIDDDEVERDQKEARKNQQEINKINKIVDVYNYTSEGWQKLIDWDKSHHIMTPAETHMIQLAVKMDGGLLTSERQCARVLKILDRCRAEGFGG